MKQCFLLSLVILTSCSLSKTSTLLKSGSIKQQEFYKTIPFELRGGLPIVKLTINGVEANFLFDTGAPSVISIQLATKLNLIAASTNYVYDSGGKRQTHEYVLIDSITMDGVSFQNTCAVIADLNASEVSSCFKIDGMIGANLMRKAFWSINYPEKSISFSNDLSKLKSSNNWDTVSFTPNQAGTPLVDMQVNDQLIKDLTFDTGSNGNILVSKNVFHLLNASNDVPKKTYRIGSVTYGMNGLHQLDTVYYATVAKLALGDLEITKPIIEFKKHGNIIGSKFLSNYNVLFDWTRNHIYMKEVNTYTFDSTTTFGFRVILENDKILIGSVFSDTEAWQKLKIGDEILEVNGVNYQGVNEVTLCDLYLNGPSGFSNLTNVTLKLKRDDALREVHLERQRLL